MSAGLKLRLKVVVAVGLQGRLAAYGVIAGNIGVPPEFIKRFLNVRVSAGKEVGPHDLECFPGGILKHTRSGALVYVIEGQAVGFAGLEYAKRPTADDFFCTAGRNA